MKKGDRLENKIEEAWKSPYMAVSEQHVHSSWKKVLLKIELQPQKRKIHKFFIDISVAASLLLLIGSYILTETHNPTIISENISSNEKEVLLPDGSLVTLKRGAQLTHKKYFDDKRHVSLRGEAFLKIAKDTLREFTVTTGSSTVKVLGTSFLIKGEENNNTEVALFTGRISVSFKGVAQSWGLVPGEKLVYNNGKVVIKDFNTQLSFEAGNQYIDINRMKMKHLIPFLQERFGYQFAANSYHPENRVTLRINKEDSLEHILKLLMIITNRKYEIPMKKSKI